MDLQDELLLFQWEDDASLLSDDFDVESSSLEAYSGNKEQKSTTQISSKSEAFLKQIDEDLDYAFALSLQMQYGEEMKEKADINMKKSVTGESKPLSIVDEQWELIDPHPDIHALFIEYDTKFFYGKLKGVEVRWSPRMTLCAGVCCYEGRGGLCSIRLSVPLLKLRPRRDLVETLLHEMIHAYLFVTHNNKDREGHGPEFLSHMNRINKETGTKISVYHSFHDEVDLYRQHWWKCNGPCQNKRPFFGLVKRAMNRVPGPKDYWWAAHEASCGGTFVKIKEPGDYKKKTTRRKIVSDPETKGFCTDIRSFLKDHSPACNRSDNSNPEPFTTKSSAITGLKSVLSKEENVILNQTRALSKKTFIPFQGTGQKLGGSSGKSQMFSNLGSVHKKRDLSSSSPVKVLDISLPKASKFPKISNFSHARNMHKDQSPGTLSITSANTPKKLIQHPIEKFLSPPLLAGSSNHDQNIKCASIYEETERNDNSIVSCPVCFDLVKKETINSHLDKCLFNNQ